MGIEDFFNQHHRQVTWADMLPRPKPLPSDRPTAEDVERLEMKQMKQEPLELKDRPIKGDPDRSRQNSQVRAGNGGTDSHTAAPTEEQQMAAAPDVPMTLDVDKEVFAYAQIMAGFRGDTERITRLAAKESVSLMDVEMAKEMEGPAILFLQRLDDPKSSKLRRWATSLFELHRQVTGRMNDLAAQPKALRRACADLYTKRDQQERARIRKEQMERERLIREEQERQRQAEIEAAKSAGATEEEVQSIEEAPMPMMAAPEPKEAAKIDGVSMVYSAKFEEITDRAAFTKWLAEHPEHMAGFEPKVSYWKTILSNNFNKETGLMSISIPGLKVKIESSPRRSGGN